MNRVAEIGPLRRSAVLLFAATTIVAAIGGLVRAEDCLICDREVVLDRKLAACFLDRYDVLQTRQGGAIAVDLTDCPEPVDPGSGEKDRGVIEALRMPEPSVGEPSPTFMITRAQLVCLKRRLDDTGLVLDPAARIELKECE